MDKEKISNIAMSKDIKIIKELNELLKQYETTGREIKKIFNEIKVSKTEINNSRDFDLLDNQIDYVNNNLKNLEFKIIKKLSCTCCGTETPIEGLIETKKNGLVCIICLHKKSQDEYFSNYKQELIFKQEQNHLKKPLLKGQTLTSGWGNFGGNGHNQARIHNMGFETPKSFVPWNVCEDINEDLSLD